MLDVTRPPGSVLPGDASVLCIPSCDLLLPHVSCHLVLHQNLDYSHKHEDISQLLCANMGNIISWIVKYANRTENLLFLAKARLVPGSPVCESLGRSPHTVEKKEM